MTYCERNSDPEKCKNTIFPATIPEPERGGCQRTGFARLLNQREPA